jgi:hypothetical protein
MLQRFKHAQLGSKSSIKLKATWLTAANEQQQQQQQLTSLTAFQPALKKPSAVLFSGVVKHCTSSPPLVSLAK